MRGKAHSARNSSGGLIMTVGERIQDLRKKKGFSQEKLAEYLNMSRQAVAKWEQNVCEPNLDCLATGVCV